jgi:hypothetical protein
MSNKATSNKESAKESAKEYWGPRFWTFLHQLCYSFPTKPTKIEKEIYKKVLASFIKMIPCPDCQGHFIALLNKYPVNMESRETMILWAYTVHNRVNKRLGKPKLGFKKANRLYNGKEHEFNHKYLYQFLRYNFDRAIYRHTSSEDIVVLLKLLNIVYPCLKCRGTYKAFYQRKPLGESLGTNKLFTEWYQLIFKPSNISGHLSRDWKKKLK